MFYKDEVCGHGFRTSISSDQLLLLLRFCSLVKDARSQPVLNLLADPARAAAANVYRRGKLAVLDGVVNATAAHCAKGEDFLQL